MTGHDTFLEHHVWVEGCLRVAEQGGVDGAPVVGRLRGCVCVLSKGCGCCVDAAVMMVRRLWRRGSQECVPYSTLKLPAHCGGPSPIASFLYDSRMVRCVDPDGRCCQSTVSLGAVKGDGLGEEAAGYHPLLGGGAN